MDRADKKFFAFVGKIICEKILHEMTRINWFIFGEETGYFLPLYVMTEPLKVFLPRTDVSFLHY